MELIFGIEPLVTQISKVSYKTTMNELHAIIEEVIACSNTHLFPFNLKEEVIADTRLVDDELGHVTDVKGVMVTHGILPCGKHRNL
jgi:hypothetical protein